MTVYLYVKEHQKTGLKYFGKTSHKNPFWYKGSGSYWLDHLKKHGYDISTTEIFGFDNQDLCTEFALKFSQDNDIVNSSEWANLKEETGLDGGSGYKHSDERKRKIPGRPKGSKDSDQGRKNRSISRKGKILVEDTSGKKFYVYREDSRIGQELKLVPGSRTGTAGKIKYSQEAKHKIRNSKKYCSCVICHRTMNVGNFWRHYDTQHLQK